MVLKFVYVRTFKLMTHGMVYLRHTGETIKKYIKLLKGPTNFIYPISARNMIYI